MKTAASVSLAGWTVPDQQIRDRAYFRWLDLGRPDGDDLAHWFWARQQLATPASATDREPAPHAPDTGPRPADNTAASALPDPTRRFHDRQTPRDARLDVVAGEARQRIRGRHFDSSLRPTQKSREQPSSTRPPAAG